MAAIHATAKGQILATDITAAVVRKKHGPFEIEQLQLDEPAAHEVLVRIEGCGVCHTDLHARDQYHPTPLPAVFGHEGAGVVERVGAGVTKVAPGDKVVLVFPSCGRCSYCRAGKPAYCAQAAELKHGGRRADGSTTLRKGDEIIHGNFFSQSSFATYALALERNTIKVHSELPARTIAALGCGIQTGAGAILNSLAVRAGSALAVFGVGSLGLSAVMAARIAGCLAIVAVDIKPNRLAVARELGATHAMEWRGSDTVDEIRRLTGDGVDYALETSAVPQVLAVAIDSLRPLGVCGLAGTAPPGTQVALAMRTIQGGRSVRGIVQGDSIPDSFIQQLLDFHAQGRFPFDRLITAYPLSGINQAAADAVEGGTIKPVLVPS